MAPGAPENTPPRLGSRLGPAAPAGNDRTFHHQAITRPAWVWNLYLEGLSSCGGGLETAAELRVDRKSEASLVRLLHTCLHLLLLVSLHSTSLMISRFQVGKGRCKREKRSLKIKAPGLEGKRINHVLLVKVPSSIQQG